MTLKELQNQALQLAISDLDPWTQSLIGVIQLDYENTTESYVDYLEEKYA